MDFTKKFDGLGDVMTVAEFRENVASTLLTDNDGFGAPAISVDGVIMINSDFNRSIYPSMTRFIPSEVTHVVWYNK